MAIDRCKQLSFSTVKLKDVRSDEWKQKVKTAASINAYIYEISRNKKMECAKGVVSSGSSEVKFLMVIV